MNHYNLILIGFIIAAFFLTLWWAFNTIRRVNQQKDFCAMQLSSIARLWHRAQFVPEDAKERESLYLYRDFLRKFDENQGQYPIMVKDGGVRCMTRKEYDNLCNQKGIHTVSILITILSLMIAGVAGYINFFLDNTYLVGIGLAVILPITQLFLAFFVKRSMKEKDNYRDGIFLALKENSVAFLSITKPFILVDAYPNKFGKNKKPLYATIGELTEEQVLATRDFIIRQKEAETKIVIANVNNRNEIKRITEKTTPKPTLQLASEVAEVAEQTSQEDENPIDASQVNYEKPTQKTTIKPAEPTIGPEQPKVNPKAIAPETLKVLIHNIIDDTLKAEITRTEQKNMPETPTEIENDVKPLPAENVITLEDPAEDDFSLEAIGQALDAEIARRKRAR